MHIFFLKVNSLNSLKIYEKKKKEDFSAKHTTFMLSLRALFSDSCLLLKIYCLLASKWLPVCVSFNKLINKNKGMKFHIELSM